MADEVDLELVRSRTKDLSKTDLRRADLSGMDLSGADLSGAKLDWIIADRANLANANLSEARVVGASFFEANLSGALLPRVLTSVKFNGANLRNAKVSISGSNIDFSLADISGADFVGSVFSEDVNFDGVISDNETRFDGVEMLRSTSRYPIFSNYDYSGGRLVRKSVVPESSSQKELVGDQEAERNIGHGSVSGAVSASSLARAVETRLAEAPKDFAFMAAMLAATVREELSRMQSSRPNQPDELVRFERLSGFLGDLAQSLDRLAEVIQQAEMRPGARDYSQAREIITAIRDRIEGWTRENKDMVVGMWRSGAIGISTAFLCLCGAPPSIAALTSVAVVGGSEVIKAVKGLIGKEGAD